MCTMFRNAYQMQVKNFQKYTLNTRLKTENFSVININLISILILINVINLKLVALTAVFLSVSVSVCLAYQSNIRYMSNIKTKSITEQTTLNSWRQVRILKPPDFCAL
jgi:hypothetical protein